MTNSDEVARMLSPANVRQALDIRSYAEGIFLSAVKRSPVCPDCLAANGGYRDTELCKNCYADRYAEDKGQNNEECN